MMLALAAGDVGIAADECAVAVRSLRHLRSGSVTPPTTGIASPSSSIAR
jgi:hypothetical protein